MGNCLSWNWGTVSALGTAGSRDLALFASYAAVIPLSKLQVHRKGMNILSFLNSLCRLNIQYLFILHWMASGLETLNPPKTLPFHLLNLPSVCQSLPSPTH